MICRRWERSRKFEKPAKSLVNFIKHGTFFGYYVNAWKRQLFANDEKYNEATKVFKNTEIEMQKGARVLGSVIGSETECKTSLETHLEEHNKKPGKIVKLSSQNVYSCWGTRKINHF